MKSLILCSLIAAISCGGGRADAAATSTKEVDVYLFAGQSNMQGLGKLKELTPAQLAPPAMVSYWNGSSFFPLIPGTTATAAAGEFGPEIAFATEIAKRGRKACIVKYYNSGKPLDAGWNDQTWLGDPPAPNRVNFHPGLIAADPNQGTLYKNAMLPRFQAALAAITAAGETPVIRGLVWMQGEQDSKNANSASRYPDNLKRLRDRLAADLSLATLPLVFGQVLPHEPTEPRFTHRAEIRAGMALVDQDSGSPKAIPLCRMVHTDGYPVYPSPDAVHYTTAGQLMLGKAFAIGLAEISAIAHPPQEMTKPKLLDPADATAPVPPGIDRSEARNWKLVWRDEFDGNAMDPAKWNHRYLGKRESSMIARDCITVENGLLRVWVKEKDGVLQNGMISTQKKFEPLYGIVAARIRFPRQQGQHGSLWMQPAAGEKVPDNPARSGAEIDIIEWFGVGRKDGGTACNLYWPGMKGDHFDAKANHAGGTADWHHLLPEGQTWSDDFHVFSVEWSPQGYIFRADGHETNRLTQGVSQVPQYLILSLLTADWETSRLDRGKLPNSMDVDWVRVWQGDKPPVREFPEK